MSYRYMFTIEHATPVEFTKALTLMKENMEAQLVSRGLSWDTVWTQNNYQDKDNYSIFRAGYWIGFLSLEVLPDSLYVHTLQLTPEAQGRINGYRVYEWILAKAGSFGKQRIECKVFKDSSASALYLRLGFELVHTDKHLCEMQLRLAS